MQLEEADPSMNPVLPEEGDGAISHRLRSYAADFGQETDHRRRARGGRREGKKKTYVDAPIRLSRDLTTYTIYCVRNQMDIKSVPSPRRTQTI